MWEVISNVSALITCVLFIAYIIGHLWVIYISRNEIVEKIEFEDIEDISILEDKDYIELGGEHGRIFSISSPKGIKKLKVFGVNRDESLKKPFIKGEFINEINNIRANEKVYFKGEFLWYNSNIYLEFERSDYIIVSLIVGESGKDGTATCFLYDTKMTLKSFLYYLCK